MLGKVLKYDLISICKNLIPLYVVLLGLSLMVRILSLFDNVSVIEILLGLMIFGLILISIFSILLTGIFSVKYYLENLFKDQAYLTHTLPVKKGILLLSKVITSLVTIICTFGVIFLGFLIAFYQVGLFGEILEFLGKSYAGIEVYKFLIFMIIYGMIVYLTTILMVYASISIGFSRSSNKIVSSVVCALIFYFIMEFLYLGLLGIIMVSNPAFISNLDNNTFMLSDLLNFFTVFMIFTAILGGVYYYISYRYMNKKLNLE